ncbi:MAG: multidrug transporter AcrB [Candidatus Eisenbacteria bacterium RBG_19FT_COMBO_70_11]|nr:MAG: multidrug transporter AcrB [Candidatus Eisenbacteria bacterium RBG_19FT_COMBO_70_11]
MKLSEISVHRPVLATVMSLAILLFGILSFTFLPVREYPDIDSPIVSITTVYRGASPQVVETEITEPIEEQISTIEGVKLITSSSAEQVSRITVEFKLNRNVEEAANDVRDRVSRIRGALPQTADDPIVAKQDVNAQPILWLALSGENHDPLAMSDLANNVLAEKLQRLDGVGAVFVGGNRRYAMRVWLDPQRLSSYGLTVADVERALLTGNAEIPSGRVEGRGREFSVRTRGDLSRPEEFAAIVVAQQGNRPVRLSEVADVRLGAEDERTIARYNGAQAVGLGVVKQQKASTVEVAQNVRNALPELRSLLPPGLRLEVAYDSSTFIKDSIHEVVVTLAIAFFLVIVVIFVFLGSLRATLIPAVAIPVSLIGAFTATYFLGFSLNILTLLALVLAIGLVVDDAIVMLENVYRHMEMGKDRVRASLDGAQEIGFAILATTVTLVAVFVPVAFLTGRIGRLFNEFGIAVAVSVLISGFVALTLTPMLCSRMLKRHAFGSLSHDEEEAAAHGPPADRVEPGEPVKQPSRFDRFFHWLSDDYERRLTGAMRHRRWVMAGLVATLVAMAVLFRMLPSELVPTEDRGLVFNIMFAPEGSTLEYTDRYVRQAEAIYRGVPEVQGMFTAVGLGFGGPGRVTDAFMFVRLKPYDERTRSQQQIVRQVFPRMLGIPGVLAFPINPPSLGGGFGRPVQFVLQAESYDELRNGVGVMLAGAQKLGYLVNMDTDLKLNKPQLEIDIDRDRAAALGVSVTDIGSTLQTLLGGRQVTNFKLGDRQYDVILQVPPRERSSPAVIEGLYLRGREGLTQMASVVHVREEVSPRELNHFNRVRSATISANLAPGVTIAKAIADLRQIARRDLPPGIRTDLAGESREYAESSGALYFLFVIALVFIYLVLSAQFESFIHPLTILLSVPLAVFGALIALWVFGMSLNIYSQIGLIMLIGLVTKNAILIVEYANQRRARGEPLERAVIGAARIRLRPILMTTLSTVFGVLPIAIGLGAGAESRKPLGTAVVGGLLFSTVLTLVVVPVFYSVLARFQKVKVATPQPRPERAPGSLSPAKASEQP